MDKYGLDQMVKLYSAKDTSKNLVFKIFYTILDFACIIFYLYIKLCYVICIIFWTHVYYMKKLREKKISRKNGLKDLKLARNFNQGKKGNAHFQRFHYSLLQAKTFTSSVSFQNVETKQ